VNASPAGTKLATHPAFRLAVRFAAERVEHPLCRAIYADFVDGAGRPLRERLERLHLSPAEHLAGLVFEDGDRDPLCRDTGDVIAYTSPLSPIVRVCTSRFVRTMHKSPPFAAATVLHEQLHTLGLGENPPKPEEITERVLAHCGR
jgi:hypothetical protein